MFLFNHLLKTVPGQDERIGELRETHRLESRSQLDLIDQLRRQMDEAEALAKANQDSTAHNEAEITRLKSEAEKLHMETERMKGIAKDEEEKRTKAVSLLKTVRQKLVKAERERDDAVKEVAVVKEKDKVEREKEKSDRTRKQGEVDKVKADKEAAIANIRAQSEHEIASLKEKHEKEVAAVKGQSNLEMITMKVATIW